MHDQLQITFRGLSPSSAVEALIQERTERLAHASARIQRCHVVLDQPHRHHHKGRPLSVRLDITTPLGEVVVMRSLDDVHVHQPVHTLIREAFDTAARQLEDRVHRRRAG
ncbi:MAG TPA: HPF/RaiA family ribosome-associated protein [Polyangiaceae bacterium]|nr:HPF/RaiA family ribosome-associated protein [Polyangiaceae bacterium]